MSITTLDFPPLQRHELTIAGGRPEDFQTLLRQVFVDLFEHQLSGAIVINRDGRVVWLNQHYAELLGLASPLEALARPVEELIPNTRLTEVMKTGEPILLDFMVHHEKTFVVTRFPIRSDEGEVLGAAGMLLYETWQPLKPLVEKFAALQSQMSDGRRVVTKQRQTRYTLDNLVGDSPACKQMKKLARRAADLDTTVLLLGETGTGKELLAQSIHADSLRTNKPFIALNVAAIPDTLLEAEIFGAAPGAYTGVDRRGRDGKFKLADGGTIFLDEVGDMSLPVQAKLLRVLQEQEFEPLGSNQLVRVDVRVIAATSRDLAAMVAEGSFRADLYYRLNVLPINLPALRNRRDDIPLLAEHILHDIGRRCGYPKRALSAGAMAWLQDQPWPGNVRELRNVLERALMLTDRALLDVSDLTGDSVPMLGGGDVRPLADVLADAERKALNDALAATGGNKAEAARLLKLGRATLYEKLAAHGIR